MNKAEIEKRINEIDSDLYEMSFNEHYTQEDYRIKDKLLDEKRGLNEKLRKAHFVEKLEEFYMVQAGNGLDVKSIEYIYDGDEKLKVTFETGVKYVWINFDGKEAILKDFVRFLNNFNDYAWEKE